MTFWYINFVKYLDIYRYIAKLIYQKVIATYNLEHREYILFYA
jgi:hypothetical protein